MYNPGICKGEKKLTPVCMKRSYVGPARSVKMAKDTEPRRSQGDVSTGEGACRHHITALLDAKASDRWGQWPFVCHITGGKGSRVQMKVFMEQLTIECQKPENKAL